MKFKSKNSINQQKKIFNVTPKDDDHFERIVSLIENNKIVVGGSNNKQELFIEPTILEINNLNVKIMKEEIFRPLLPVIKYNNYSEIIKIVEHNPNPLALYTFSNNKNSQRKLTTTYHLVEGV